MNVVAYIGPAGVIQSELTDSDDNSQSEDNTEDNTAEEDNETNSQCAYSQELVASAAHDFIIRIWDIRAFVCLQICSGHTDVSTTTQPTIIYIYIFIWYNFYFVADQFSVLHTHLSLRSYN